MNAPFIVSPDICRTCQSRHVHMKCIWHPTRANTTTIVLACQQCGAISEPEKLVGMTEEEIEAGKSPAGGFTKAQLAQWGVPWPPPKGWRKALITGRHFWK